MIDTPMPFKEAIEFILDKDPDPKDWSARQWSLMEPEVRNRAFFSAKIEDARFLDRAQTLIFEFLTDSAEDVTLEDGTKTRRLLTSNRADFVRRMREFMVAEGMADSEEEFAGVSQTDIQDVRSEDRLRLIFDTNVRQSEGFGQWKQGMTPAVLRRFPAARLIRQRGVMEPRLRHAASEGEVRLKTDEAWWAGFQNDPAIGGFGVPWPPYGFNSGMGQEDVSREEAIALGLNVDSVAPPEEPRKLTDGVKTELDDMSPEIRRKLIADLRNPPKSNMEDAALEAVKRVKERNRQRAASRGQ